MNAIENPWIVYQDYGSTPVHWAVRQAIRETAKSFYYAAGYSSAERRVSGDKVRGRFATKEAAQAFVAGGMALSGQHNALIRAAIDARNEAVRPFDAAVRDAQTVAQTAYVEYVRTASAERLGEAAQVVASSPGCPPKSESDHA